MKKALLVVLLVSPILVSAEKPKPAPNPADYTISVHVQSSHLFVECSGGICPQYERMDVLIDGKKYELTEFPWRKDLLRVGDYKARVFKEETTRPYEYARTYQFLFSDGTTREYTVTGEGE